MSILKRLIGITGPKGSGKDTAVQSLVESGYVVIKFADGLKNMLRTYLREYGLDDVTIERMIEGDLKEVPHDAFCGRTPRHAMQTLGTEWGRMMIGPKLWTNLFKKKASRHEKVACTDLRFMNEDEAMQEIKKDGVEVETARIVRPNKDGTVADLHQSEVEQYSIGVNHVVRNDGTIEELRGKLVAIAR
jgi:hypothetical protein